MEMERIGKRIKEIRLEQGVIATKIRKTIVGFTRYSISLGKRQKCADDGFFNCNRNKI